MARLKDPAGCVEQKPSTRGFLGVAFDSIPKGSKYANGTYFGA